MDCYCVKTHTNTAANLIVTGENDTGYFIRIIRDLDGYEEITDDFMERNLFASCIRTGYLSKTGEFSDKKAAIA